ncbi:MAG TPA: rod shape-determining protein RodA [Candidatus Paceibacterota bacterium]
MLSTLRNIFVRVDFLLLGVATLIVLAGMLTMNSFTGENNLFFRQLLWLIISLLVAVGASRVDWRFLRNTRFITAIYFISVFVLLLLSVIGSIFRGAQSWFDLGLFAFQPTDFAKIALILVLSKYFARRHVEIAHVRHIVVSGLYTLIIFMLVFLQPDFGGAIIIFIIWLGMVFASGISKRHIGMVFASGILAVFVLWSFVFQDYQKARITSFLHPLADVSGAGYNAYQSTVAVGSGEIWGKGIGYGTQSKLKFLPEYETDFIFASFAEEWGFVGSLILFSLYATLIFRILSVASQGETNFEVLYGFGVGLFFTSHFFVNIGMNIGLLPVTGITLPFMSYGGSHLLAEFLAIGILMGTSKYARVTRKGENQNEIIQVTSYKYR